MWLRRRLALLLLSPLAVCMAAGPALAGTVSEQYTGWSFSTLPSEGGQDAGAFSRPASGAGDFRYEYRVACGAADYSGSATMLTAQTSAAPWVAASGFLPSDCTAPQVVWQVIVYAFSNRGTSLMLRWTATGAPQTGSWNAATVQVSPSPTPVPTPVYFPSPWPSPEVVATYYAYPTPPAGGGGSVDSCAASTCTVTLAAGTSVGLDDWQWISLCGFLGLLLILGLVRFWRTEGGALRV